RRVKKSLRPQGILVRRQVTFAKSPESGSPPVNFLASMLVANLQYQSGSEKPDKRLIQAITHELMAGKNETGLLKLYDLSAKEIVEAMMSFWKLQYQTTMLFPLLLDELLRIDTQGKQ